MADDVIKQDYLREAGLFCDDPMAQSPLYELERLTIEQSSFSPENRYNYRLSNVFCHACGRHNHYKGITVKGPNGQTP